MSTTDKTTVFVDTNVLIAATDRSRATHAAALQLLDQVPRWRGHLCWSGQVKREYLVVATRPLDRNGLGLEPSAAVENTRYFSRQMNLLDESGRVSRRLEELVIRHDLKGKRIHDASIVATMLEAGLTLLVTNDGTDYQPFGSIQALTPAKFITRLKS